MAFIAKYSEESLTLLRAETEQPLITQTAYADHRPYIHPIVAPDGNGMLTENAPAHHPWQHGLYVGLNRVNGVGFWAEGLTGHPMDGTFHPIRLSSPVLNKSTAQWIVQTEWRDPQGKPMIMETQQWSFTDRTDDYVLDLDWTLLALTDLEFGEYPYGGLFIRMPYRDENGGIAINSEGQRNEQAEAQRAKWVGIGMPIEGRTDWAGMALMDHPSNPEFPVPWRVDAQYGIAPSRCIAGAWSLAEGKAEHFKHRVLIYTGEPPVERIEQSWQDFTYK